MVLLPPQFDTHPAFELLLEAEAGRIGFDQRLLRSLVARPDETVAALVRFSSEIRPDRMLDMDEQVLDLFRHFKSPAAIPFYLRQAQRGVDGIPDEVVDALAVLGAPAVEPLLEAIGKAGEDDRGDLIFLLAALGVRDARIPPLIEQALDADVYEGALCAGLYGDPELIPALDRALGRLPEGEEARHERSAIEGAKAEIAAGPREHEPFTFDLFKLYPEAAPPHFGALPEDQVEEYLSCDFAEYRRYAALSLCEEDYNEDTRDALLKQAREDNEADVRAAAMRALGSVCDADAKVREYLFEVLDGTETTLIERGSATVALSNAPASGALHEAIRELYEIPETRADAVEAMWRTRDLRYRRYFGENLRHADANVRAAAATAVGVYPIPDLAIELMPLFDDEDTRGQALFSYALAVPGKTSAKSVEKLLEKIDELAGGLSNAEYDTVTSALDARLEREGLPPHFHEEEEEQEQGEGEAHVHGPGCGHDHDHDSAPAPAYRAGRNDPCPCGSGRKFKKCHGAAQ